MDLPGTTSPLKTANLNGAATVEDEAQGLLISLVALVLSVLLHVPVYKPATKGKSL
jgi:hypothetical protein